MQKKTALASGNLNSRKVDQNRSQHECDYYDRHVVALLDLGPPREPWEGVRLHSSMILSGAKSVRGFALSFVVVVLCHPERSRGTPDLSRCRGISTSPRARGAELLLMPDSLKFIRRYLARAVVGVHRPRSRKIRGPSATLGMTQKRNDTVITMIRLIERRPCDCSVL